MMSVFFLHPMALILFTLPLLPFDMGDCRLLHL